MKVMKMKCKSMKYNVISTLFVMLLFSGALFAGFYFQKNGGTSSSYFFGGATGLLLVAIANSIRILRMKKNPKYKKEQETAQKDERLISLRNRSMAVAYYLTVMGAAVASIISAVRGDMNSAENFSLLLSMSLVVYLVSYLILSHKE